ncbi:MAG: hydroxymethylglutaryl-CoA lyase [Desulfobacteraceae bacterium]|jgi:hydroxymethylglutaryl-CoA lyase
MNPNDTSRQVLLEDGALRDGLQAESRIFSLDEKVSLFEKLKRAGVAQIQVGSFVHPAIVPQMADTDALVRTIGKQTQTVVSALVLNEKGLERALGCGVAHVNMSVSVSDTHSRKNARMPAQAALVDMVALIGRALASDLQVRAGLQCAFGCVFEGPIGEDVVLAAAEEMVRTGVEEINLADTTGMATPHAVQRLIHRFDQVFPHVRISLHLHDTRGLGLANMWAGYEAGVRSFDVCAGGLGGCPFVKGAAGNVPTEDAVNLFEASGIPTGIDQKALCHVVDFLETRLGRKLPGRMQRVMNFQCGGD